MSLPPRRGASWALKQISKHLFLKVQAMSHIPQDTRADRQKTVIALRFCREGTIVLTGAYCLLVVKYFCELLAPESQLIPLTGLTASTLLISVFAAKAWKFFRSVHKSLR